MNWPIDTYRPPLGEARTLLLVAACVLAAGWLYLRRGRSGSEEVEPGAVLTWPQRVALLVLRALAIAGLAWILAGPSSITTQPRRGGPMTVAILADRSASMAESDGPGAVAAADRTAPTRWQSVTQTWLEPAFLEQVRQRSDLHLFTFDERATAADQAQIAALTPTGRGTHLFSVIGEMLGGASANDAIAVAAARHSGILVILSDGHDTQRGVDPLVLQQIRRSGWRVMTVAVGQSRSVADVAVAAWADADFLFPGQSTFLNAAISHAGFAGESVQIDLLLEGTAIDTQQILLTDEPSQRVRFKVSPPSTAAAPNQPALLAYQIAVKPVAGERVIDNNARHVFVQVQRERIRVALFEGQPYWDTRSIVRVLGDDAQVDLTAIYGLGPDRVITTHYRGGQTPGSEQANTPGGSNAATDAGVLTAEQLAQFDVIILGQGAEQFFGGQRAQLLVDFVTQRGGSLVLARGRAFDSDSQAGREAQAILGAIEPVAWGRGTIASLQLELTAQGKSDPLTRFEEPGLDAVVTRLPDMLAASRIEGEKAASIVLLRQRPRDSGDAAGMAAVTYQNAGKGKVLAVLTDGLWRWSLLPSRLREFDSIYQVFWSRTIRWLATGGDFLPGQSVAMRLSKLTAEPGETVAVSVATRYVDPAFQPRLFIRGPAGAREEVTLVRTSEQSAQFRASLRRDAAGIHELELSAPGMQPDRLAARLAVYDQSAERLDTSAQPATLEAIAEAGGGECLGPGERERLLDYLAGAEAAREVDERADYTFEQPAVFVLIVSMLGLEWFVRRRNGLA